MAIQLSTGLRNALLGSADFKTAFTDGIFEIFSGDQPVDADAAETGTKLLRITLASGAFTPGVATNGINFDAPAAGVIAKAVIETWSGVALASGTAGWFRFYANAVDTGISTTAVRFDGSIGTTGAELSMPNLSIVETATTTIDAFEVTLPATVV